LSGKISERLRSAASGRSRRAPRSAATRVTSEAAAMTMIHSTVVAGLSARDAT